jgi:integrase
MTTKKKRKSRGGVFTRKDRPGWWIMYRDCDGKRRRESVEAATADQAREIRAAKVIEARQIREGLKARPEPTKVPASATLRHVADQFLASQKSRLSAKGYKREQGIIDGHLLAYFDGSDDEHPNKTRSVTVLMVERYIAQRLTEEASPWTVRKEVNSLRHLYRYARKHGLSEFNPAKDAELPPEPEPLDRWLTADELNAVVKASPAWLRPIILLGAFTGCRLSEILGLRPCDIKIAEKRAMLPKTKSRKPRRVFLNASAVGVLSTLGLSRRDSLAPIFDSTEHENTSGKKEIIPITQNRVSTQYARAVKSAGIPPTRFHDLRHTAASHWHEEGLDDHTIARLLGQKSVKTSRGYQGMSAQFLEDAAARLDDRLGVVLKSVSHPQATKTSRPN